MRRRRWLVTGAATFFLYLALAGVGFDRYILVRHPDRPRLVQLIVPAPPAGFDRKPTGSNVVTATADPFPVYRTLAPRDSAHSGAYTVSWGRRSSSTDSATVLVSYLPSPADAARVQAQAVTQFTGPSAFKNQNYTFLRTAPVPQVPGARAAVYTAGAKGTPPVVAVVFQTGRAQVLILFGRTGTAPAAGAAAATLAGAEYRHLQATLPAFALGVTDVPPLATSVYWAAVAGIAAVALGGPLAVRRTRRNREERRRRAARRQQQVRGSKIARRQAPRSR